MVKDPNGYIAFDKDGVLRSYNSDNQVIGYYQLNTTQISKMISGLPSGYDKAAMTETFAGVDGTKVTGKLAHTPTSTAQSIDNLQRQGPAPRPGRRRHLWRCRRLRQQAR